MDKRSEENKNLIKIAVTGPESTGKTSLAEKLSAHFNTNWVPEFARTYIDELSKPYTIDDILIIAQNQLKTEQYIAGKTSHLLFSDTELIVTKIWAEFKFKHCPQWIMDQLPKQQYNLYLLCDIDTPWEHDPQREHPHLRKELFDLYKNELNQRKLPFKIVNGLGEERLKNAIRFVNGVL